MTPTRRSSLFSSLALAFAMGAPDARAQIQAVRGLEPKPFTSLSDSNVTPLGRTALEVRPTEWLHSETENFIYHYFQDFIATPVSSEAEFHYKYIARELKKDTTRWERKSRIFIFDTVADGEAFKASGGLDPWTGGLHSNNELFVLRNAARKWKGHALAHEVCHLVLYRFFGGGLPLWINEGYSENVGIRSYGSFFRARGYQAKPWSYDIKAEHYVPVKELTGLLDYPENAIKINAFYTESEKLVRYLTGADRDSFLKLLDDLSGGSYFNTALFRHYGRQWTTMDAFEKAFKEFALGDLSATDALKKL